MVFVGIATVEWFAGWLVWEQFELWTVVKNTTWQFFIFLLISATLLGVSMVVFLKSRKNSKDTQKSVAEVEVLHEKVPKSDRNVDFIEAKRREMLSPESVAEETIKKNVEPLLEDDVDEERAKKSVRTERLKKIAQKIASGEIEVTPTEKDYAELGISKLKETLESTPRAKKLHVKLRIPDENELKTLKIEEEEK